jgi:hypothetical protein
MAAAALATRQDEAGAAAETLLRAAATRLRARVALLGAESVPLEPWQMERVRAEVELELRQLARTWGDDLAARAEREADEAGAVWSYTTAAGLPSLAADAGALALARRRSLEVGTAGRVALDATLAAIAALSLWLTATTGQRLTSRQLADALTTGPRSAMLALAPRWRQHADLFISRSANATLLEASEAAHVAVPTFGLLKRDVEVFDLRRNHPISRVLDGQTIPVQASFRAPVAQVEAWAARLRKPSGGIFWPVVKGDYVGLTLPAHFGERGVVVPWLPSWST